MSSPIAQIGGIPVPTIMTGFKFFGPTGYDNPNLPGQVVSQLLIYAIVIGGLIFFVKLIAAGFGFLTSAGDPGKIQAATKGLTNALIGLLLVFSTYFIIQILQVIFGINIL